MTPKKSVLQAFPYLAPLLLLFLTWQFFTACEQSPSSLPHLRIGHAPHDHHSPLYIAALNPDYFKKNGGIYLREITARKKYELVSPKGPLALVDIAQSTGGTEIIRKLAEKHFDIAFGGIPAILQFIDKGKNLRIIAPVMTEGAGLLINKNIPANNWEEFTAFVKQSDRPIRIGYKIAFSVQNVIFEQALTESGVSFSTDLNDTAADIILMNLYGAKNLIPALKESLIDGFVVMQPFLALAEDKNLGKLICQLKDLPPKGVWEGFPCCALAADQDYTQRNPAVVEALVTLMLRANRFITQHPGPSADMVAEWLNISAAVEQKSLPTINFLGDYDEAWRKNMTLWIQLMIEQELLNDKIPKTFETKNSTDFIYNMDILNRAKESL